MSDSTTRSNYFVLTGAMGAVFADANAFGERVRERYIKLGYIIIDVSFIPAKERAQFIVDEINLLIRKI